MKHPIRDCGLSILLFLLFLAFWAGQALAGFRVHHQDALLHGGELLSFPGYLASGHFWQATAENWESEFLQMGAYVILTTRLFQRGSAESNDPDKAVDLAAKRQLKRGSWLYRNSLVPLLRRSRHPSVSKVEMIPPETPDDRRMGGARTQEPCKPP